MKKQCLYFLRLAALALALVLAACSNPSDTPPNNPDPPLSISGKFTTDTGTSYFKAQEDSVTRAAASQVSISGTLDDGAITFRLKGFYDKESGAYTLQAASSIIKYSINGTASGGASASVAMRSSANEPFGPPTYVPITTEISGAVLDENMTSPPLPDKDIADGLTREDVWGVWYENSTWGEFKYVVNEWGITWMQKENGEWVEGETMGFSKITEEDDDSNSITVIGDATVAHHEPVEWDPEAFAAYAKSKGLEVFDVNNTPFPGTDDIFLPRVSQQLFQHNINEDFRQGALVKGTGTYVVEIKYAPDGLLSGSDIEFGTSEKPFVVERVIQEGAQEDLVTSVDAVTAATLKDALDAALDAIKAKTNDMTVDYDPELPWTFTNAGMAMSFAIEQWEEENLQPAPPANLEPNSPEMDAWFNANGDELNAWFVAHEAFLKAQLLAKFHERFPNADKLIMPNSPEYTELMTQYTNESMEENVTYKTEYYKWNVTEANGRLIIKAYSTSTTDSEFQYAYVDSYAKAEALDQLVTTPMATLSR